MDNSHSLIRLVDVALIILLGFIAISSLKTDFIVLPSGASGDNGKENSHAILLRLQGESFEIVDESRRAFVHTIDELELAITNLNKSYRSAGESIVINIETDNRVIVQQLVDVIDICQRHRIPQSLNYAAF